MKGLPNSWHRHRGRQREELLLIPEDDCMEWIEQIGAPRFGTLAEFMKWRRKNEAFWSVLRDKYFNEKSEEKPNA